MHPNFLRTDVFASAVISYAYAKRKNVSHFALFVCFGEMPI